MTSNTTDSPRYQEIVAGIINMQTGELSDLIANPSGKSRLALKARDELNAVHGRDAFMVFEFNSIGGSGNLDYIARNMKAENPAELLKVAYLLQARYRIQETEHQLSDAKNALAEAEETRTECLALYEGKNKAKAEIVSNAFEHEITELESDVSSLSDRLAQQKRTLAQREAACAPILLS
mgnify:CR=1 FL=1